MGINHELNNNQLPKSTLFATKASKVQQVRKSYSSPTANTNELPATINPSMIISSNSELNKTSTIPISPSSNKNNKKKRKPIRLNTKLSNINHFSSSPQSTATTTSTTTSTHERPNLRMSASSRFGKNLLPTWLGGHSTEEEGTSPTSSIHSTNSSSSTINLTTPTTSNTPPLSASGVSIKSSSSTLTISNCSINNNEISNSTSPNLDSNELTSTFETLLDELNMKDAHREKLRQLPRERKLYLLKQNEHIKENKAVDSSLRKSMPTSNSSTSIFPHKGLRNKTATIKRSETSTRLLFPSNNDNKMGNSSSHRSLVSSLIANSSVEDMSSLLINEEISPPSPMPTPHNPHQQQHHGSQKKNHINNNKKEIHEKPGASFVNTTPIVKSSVSAVAKSGNDPIITNSTVIPSTSPVPTQADGPILDRRAATYKYARRNLTSPVDSNRSKVGSMIMEFDALAHKLEDTTSDESAAWLLLDNKTLPRHYNINNTARSNNINNHPSVSNLFPTASTTSNATPSDTVSTNIAETSASSSILSNSYAYQSLTRKDGSHLASLVSSSSPVMDDTIKRGRDRNSPYYYVERLRSRNITTDALTKHLTSLRITLATGNVSWINEFLSRRHSGLVALENVLEKMTSKKQKKKSNTIKLTDAEGQCLFECIKCIKVLLNTKPGLQQVLMRPVVLQHLIIALFACLASISVVQPTPSSSSIVFKKSPSITSIGSQLLPSFSSNSGSNNNNNISPSPSRSTTSNHTKDSSNNNNANNNAFTMAYKMCTLIFEILSALCIANSPGYDTVLAVISEVKGEQYRFERLVQSLHDLGGITQNNSVYHDKKNVVSILSSFIEEQQELLVFDCLTAALSLFNSIVQTPNAIEKRSGLRSELERRGFEELVKRLEQKKDVLPDSLEKQISMYLSRKKMDTDKLRELESTKRQSILQLQPDDMVASALKVFYSDPEIYYLVVDSISELITVGTDQLSTNKRFVQDIWSLIHIFAKNLKPIRTNNDFQSALQQFVISIQPIVGKLSNTNDQNEEENSHRASIDSLLPLSNTKNNSNSEDVEGLRNMVEELKDNFIKSQDATARIRREKNELLMKVSKALAVLKERDDRIATMELEKQDMMQKHYQEMLVSPTTTATLPEIPNLDVAPSPPPPPPPPPPPISSLSMNQQQEALNPIIKRRNLVRRNSSHRNSRYLHPLALNLCFPNLKSLHENAATTNGPTSPTGSSSSTTSPISPTVNNNHSFRLDMSNQHTINDYSHPPPIVMKQFFWSKLPMDKIENTVWNEIVKSPTSLIHDTISFKSSSSSSSESSTDEDESFEQVSIQLDTVELEHLFKKGQKDTASATNTVTAPLEIRKQNLITLLEFNRANNIAIMLAKIKLPYPDIRDAIWNIDDNSLSTDNLMAIRQYIPTKEEIEIVKEYQGDIDMLGNAERYYRSIMYIPRLADRVSCMIFRRRFKDELEEILPELDIIQIAITELKSSLKFKHVLKTVLAIGNYLNGQTIRGNACGFHLDALLKMRDTRAEGEGISNVPTLLHYLVYFLSKSNDDVVNFRQDISHLQAAAKLSPPTLFATVNSLNGNLSQIKEELNMNRRRKTSELQIDRFAEAMEEFVLEAEPVVNDLKAMTRDIEEKLKDLIVYYGEDPNTIKSEEFFDIISTFSNSFEKAQVEIHEARERALKRQRQQEMQLKKRQQQQQQQQQQQITSSSNYGIASTCSSSSPIMDSFIRPTEEGFEQVLRELKAGLRSGDESWQNTISRRNKMRATLAFATIAE